MSFNSGGPSRLPDAPGEQRTTQWGIASILLGVILLVAVPLGSIAVGAGFAAFGMTGSRLTENDVHMLFTVILVAILAILPLPITGLGFGIHGLRSASRSGAPRALPLTGIVLCALNLLLLGITLVIVLIIRSDIFSKGKPFFGFFLSIFALR